MKKVGQLQQLVIKHWWVIVGITMLAAFVLILFLGQNQQVWFDESYSILLAKQPLGTLLSLTSVDAHPPLFYLLLKAWGSVFGWSELALRSMSALIAVLTIGAMSLLLRRLFSVGTAIISLPFLVLSPFFLRYGYEIRMYMLACLIGVIASLVLLRAIRPNADKKWWLIYGLTVTLGMYTLYMTALIWLSHAVWLFLRDRRQFWRRSWFKAYVGAAVVFLLYIPTVIFQLTHSALPGVGELLSVAHISGLISLFLVYMPDWDLNSWISGGILAFLVLFIYVFVKVYGRATSTHKNSLNFLLIMTLLAPLIFIVVSLPMSQPFFVPRYLAHIALFVYALLGSIVALGWHYGVRRSTALLATVSLVLMIVGISHLTYIGNFNFERSEWQQARTTRQLVDCSKTVVIADDPYTYMNNLYYFDGCSMRFYSTNTIYYQGGYAWLTHHGNQLTSPAGVNAPRITDVRMNNAPRAFYPDSRYRQVSSASDSQESVTTYDLIGH